MSYIKLSKYCDIDARLTAAKLSSFNAGFKTGIHLRLAPSWVHIRSILSIVIELISLAQTPIDNNKYGFRVGKNPNGYDWGK